MKRLRAQRLKWRWFSLICITAAVVVAARLPKTRPVVRTRSGLERGQCTWYAFERAQDSGWRIRFDTNWGRHGRAWWEKVVNADRGTEPRPGAIMVLDAWPGNPYGHVGYVEEVEDDRTWVISHANFAVGAPWTEREGVTIYRAIFERARGGVRLQGCRAVFQLKGFLYPPRPMGSESSVEAFRSGNRFASAHIPAHVKER